MKISNSVLSKSVMLNATKITCMQNTFKMFKIDNQGLLTKVSDSKYLQNSQNKHFAWQDYLFFIFQICVKIGQNSDPDSQKFRNFKLCFTRFTRFTYLQKPLQKCMNKGVYFTHFDNFYPFCSSILLSPALMLSNTTTGGRSSDSGAAPLLLDCFPLSWRRSIFSLAQKVD